MDEGTNPRVGRFSDFWYVMKNILREIKGMYYIIRRWRAFDMCRYFMYITMLYVLYINVIDSQTFDNKSRIRFRSSTSVSAVGRGRKCPVPGPVDLQSWLAPEGGSHPLSYILRVCSFRVCVPLLACVPKIRSIGPQSTVDYSIETLQLV